jgi:putative membrane protein insertion efficiency factor/ribonuclease P protein component
MRRSDEFTSVVRGGARTRRGRLVVHFEPDLSADVAPRVGLIVGKSVGRSVVRHRVARRLRAQLAEWLAVLPAGSGVVVRALPGAAAATSEELAIDLDAALRWLLADRGGPQRDERRLCSDPAQLASARGPEGRSQTRAQVPSGGAGGANSSSHADLRSPARGGSSSRTRLPAQGEQAVRASAHRNVSMSVRFALWVIRGWQVLVSSWRAPSCRFTPSCSAYAALAIERFGLGRGSYLAVRRLLRCHPWHRGGHDPVPPVVAGSVPTSVPASS